MAKKAKPLPECGIVSGNIGKPQRRAIRPNGWTISRRKRFLDCLAATCNVNQSTAFVGMSESGVYALRRRDADFAEQFQQALEMGYVRMEAGLLDRVVNGGGIRVPLPGDAELDGKTPTTNDIELPDPAQIDPEIALRVLQYYHRRVTDPKAPRRSGRRPARATEAETNAAILKRLRALHRRLLKEAEKDAKDSDGTGLGLGGNNG